MNRIMTKENMLHYPLSGSQMEFLNPNSKLVIYTEINNINNINDLFDDTDSLIILYLIKSSTNGHWTTLFKNSEGFNFFDSYGFYVDRQLDFLTPEQRIDLNEKKKKLYQLLEPYDVIYNNVRFQGKNTQTCGAHVSYRLKNKKLTAQQYYDLFKKNKITNADYFVSDYVFKKINNIQ